MFRDDDDDLSQVDNISRKSSLHDRGTALIRKDRDRARDKRNRTDAVANDKASNKKVCLCEHCGRTFYCDKNVVVAVCPYCRVKHHIEEAEEVKVTQPGFFAARQAGRILEPVKLTMPHVKPTIMLKADKADTRFDDAKSQLSLQIGSAEYNEYVADRQASSPQRPVDEFHEKLAERNEMLPQVRTAGNEEKPVGDLLERKTAMEARKRQIHDEALAAVKQSASQTESTADDKAVTKIGTDNPIMNSMGVDEDEYFTDLQHYVDGLSN